MPALEFQSTVVRSNRIGTACLERILFGWGGQRWLVTTSELTQEIILTQRFDALVSGGGSRCGQKAHEQEAEDHDDVSN